ncbi:MAG: glycosyltransferase [Bacteroidales bacterium]|nr:glycosyltransferase [Bacteroidales bacterium]
MLTTNIKIGFVILHYQAFDMTIKCVDNLLYKFSSKNIIIVLIDNASPNKSCIDLCNKYQNNEIVKIIQSDINLGFAKGNNLGYDYLKSNYNLDFMIVMNSDVIINQDDFIEKIYEIYNKNDFAVLGPSIFAPSISLYQNPGPLKFANIQQTKQFIKRYKKFIINDYKNYYLLKILHYLVFWWAKPIYKFIFKNKTTKYNVKNQPNLTQIKSIKNINEVENSVLCGACYIFSKDFIDNRNYCFYPKTFLYFEEQILAYQCNKLSLKMLYSPNIEVIHYLDVSSEQSDDNKRNRYLNMWRHNIKSAKIYLDLLINNKLE